MHGNVDIAAHQGEIELLGEETFAARFRQWPVLDGVPGRLDDDDLNGAGAYGKRGGKTPLQFMRLRERQRTAARADSERRGFRGR